MKKVQQGFRVLEKVYQAKYLGQTMNGYNLSMTNYAQWRKWEGGKEE